MAPDFAPRDVSAVEGSSGAGPAVAGAMPPEPVAPPGGTLAAVPR